MALTVLQQPNPISYSRNPIVVSAQLEVFPGHTNIYALLTVYQSIDDVVAVLFARPDSHGNVSFDVSAVLDTLVNFEVPNLAAGINEATQVIKPYWLELQQFDGVNLVEVEQIGNTNGIITLKVMKGGVSQENVGLDIFQKINNEKMFLSWAETQNLHASQPYLLFYIHQDSVEATLAVKLAVKYTDGTRTSSVLFYKYVSKGDVVYFNAGFDINNIGIINPDKTVLNWCFWIENAGNETIAEKVYFKPSEAYTRTPVFILYANSLGGYNSLYASGETSREISGESQDIEQYLSSAKMVSGNAFYKAHSSKVATGYLTENDLMLLSDIYLSDSRYECRNNQLKKIILESKTKIGFIENESLPSGIIEYSRAIQNKNYTPDYVVS